MSYFEEALSRFYRFRVLDHRTVLEIGSDPGSVLSRCQSRAGMGIGFSEEAARVSSGKYPQFSFEAWSGNGPLPESVKRAFPEGVDFILLVNAFGYWQDVQQSLNELKPLCHSGTRIISTHYNILWSPLLRLGRRLKLHWPSPALNWLSVADAANFLSLSGYRVVKQGFRIAFPFSFFGISDGLNRLLPNLPGLGHLRMINFTVARLPVTIPRSSLLVSVIIPARNELKNIEPAVRRLASIAEKTQEKYEIIFVEGHSTDGTAAEVDRVMGDSSFSKPFPVSMHRQSGQGKGDAVRLGFSKARGDLLVILDADLTVPPEDVTKFVEVYCEGRGEFINGSRLVYQMEKEAMRPMNLIGNKFFSWAFTWLLDQRFKDTLCGTKVLSKRHYEQIAAGRSYFGGFDPFGDFDLIFGASKLDLEIADVPIRYRERIYGTTNIQRWKHGWILLRMCFYALGKIKFTP